MRLVPHGGYWPAADLETSLSQLRKIATAVDIIALRAGRAAFSWHNRICQGMVGNGPFLLERPKVGEDVFC